MTEKKIISQERQLLFDKAERELHFTADIYPLGSRFENLSNNLARIWMLDVTGVPGCHYGLKNIFVPIIKNLETEGIEISEKQVSINPGTTILVEPTTGNGGFAFSDAAEMLGYQHVLIMPDGLPQARYKHPKGRPVEIIKTPAEDYSLGMPRKLKELIKQNPERLARGEKIYVTPNHPVSAAEITIKAMSELGIQLLNQVGNQPLITVVSMGNGASLCALGEYVKQHAPGSLVIATESFVFGDGYDKFAQIKGLLRYKELYGIEPANRTLMKTFEDYGSNAPIGIELPLQTRAMSSDLIDLYVLTTNTKALETLRSLMPKIENFDNAGKLPNRSNLPQALIDRFGNTTLGNIATASQLTNQSKLVVAMAYDGRENYV